MASTAGYTKTLQKAPRTPQDTDSDDGEHTSMVSMPLSGDRDPSAQNMAQKLERGLEHVRWGPVIGDCSKAFSLHSPACSRMQRMY